MKEKYKEINFRKSVENAISYREVCRNVGVSEKGGSINTIKKYIDKYNISTNHFLTKEEHLIKSSHARKIPLKDILVKNSTYTNMERLKTRLVRNNLKEYKCVLCENEGSWCGKELKLQIDHINGIRSDNRLQNLRFLCPNCHSQTKTFSGKNKCVRS